MNVSFNSIKNSSWRSVLENRLLFTSLTPLRWLPNWKKNPPNVSSSESYYLVFTLLKIFFEVECNGVKTSIYDVEKSQIDLFWWGKHFHCMWSDKTFYRACFTVECLNTIHSNGKKVNTHFGIKRHFSI